MIVGILGLAGTGKDTVANILVKHGFQRIGFADRLKRVCREIFDFTDEQLWGTIEQKEACDFRYHRPEHTWGRGGTHDMPKCLCCGVSQVLWLEESVQCYLTPRYAMKLVGTEGARHCWENIWVKRALEDATLIQECGFDYTQSYGIDDLTSDWPRNAVFIDNRFINEVEGIYAAGGRVYRLKRAGYERPMFDHQSETEQLKIPDDRLSGVIYNDGTLEDLKAAVLATVRLS